jgi:hypothetical protein
VSDRYITEGGQIINVDPYQTIGRGVPDGWESIWSITPEKAMERLPDIIREFDERLRRLEDR